MYDMLRRHFYNMNLLVAAPTNQTSLLLVMTSLRIADCRDSIRSTIFCWYFLCQLTQIIRLNR